MPQNNRSIKEIDISEFNYDLPDELIARHPLPRRDDCRLLVALPGRDVPASDALERVLPDNPSLSHHKFNEIADLLPEDTLLVRNNTKVINARLEFHKETGARIEVFLLDPLSPADYALNFQQTESCAWKCMVGNAKKWKEGCLSEVVSLPDGHQVTVSAERGDALPGNACEIRFSWTPAVSFGELVSAFGNIPIPPYLNRESEESDLTDYQTVYAESQGSVAAPTAGLHFTDELFDRIRRSGRRIDVADVTLHVGAGTFRPVKAETLEGHDMHSETFTISRDLVEDLIDALERKRIVAAVGTTTVRTLESLPYLGAIIYSNHIDRSEERRLHVGQWDPYNGAFANMSTLKALRAIITEMNLRNVDELTASTSILIGPDFRWQIVDVMVTNFHQPESTLLLLVSSFLGMTSEFASDPEAHWRRIYKVAVAEGYRFLSYGDACLFFRHAPSYYVNLDIPGSKSISNRVLILNALAGPDPELKSDLDNLSPSTDTSMLAGFISGLDSLSTSGAPMPVGLDFYIGDGATPLRFAAALSLVTPGAEIRLFPSRRLAERLMMTEPVLFKDTPFAIAPDRANETSLSPEDRARCFIDDQGRAFCYRISGRSWTGQNDLIETGSSDPIVIDCAGFSHTSQEISALLLVSSGLPAIRYVNVSSLPSLPYVMMTAMILLSFDAAVEIDWAEAVPTEIRTSPVSLRAPERYEVEGDWSNLLNFIAFTIAAASTHPPRLIGLSTPKTPSFAKSLQPDARQTPLFIKLLGLKDLTPEERRENGFDVDFSDFPDSLPPFVAACLAAGVPFRATGLSRLAAKESDRVSALVEGFSRLGWNLERPDPAVLVYDGAPRGEITGELLDPHADHRIAMAFAVVLPVVGSFSLLDPGCVDKSDPYFWNRLQTLGVTVDPVPSSNPVPVALLTYIQ